MPSVWHAIVAVSHWLYAHLASIGITVVVTAIGGCIMWPLILRKTRLEIEHLKLDTQRLEFEVQRLADEKMQREAARNVASLSERIIELAKQYTKKNPGWGSSAPFDEEQFCSELSESQEAIVTALKVLQSNGHAEYKGQLKRWIIKV